MDYDIIVIGAGPAGSVFAYLCPEDKKTLLVNGSKQRYLGKGKPCGGLVSTDAQSFLEKHNMKIPEDIYVTPQRNE